MPQIEFTYPPDVRDVEAFNMYMLQDHDRKYGLGSGTKGVLDSENIPGLVGDPAIKVHIDDTSIHFTQSSISITESQISDFGSYEPANSNIQATVTAYNAHLSSDSHTQYALLAGRAGGQILVGGTASGDPFTINSNASNDGLISLGSLVNIDEATGKVSLTPTVDGISITLPSAGSGLMTGLEIVNGGSSGVRYEKGFEISVVGGSYAAGGPVGGNITVGASDNLGHGVKCLMNGTYFDSGFIADMPNVATTKCKGFKAVSSSSNFVGDMFYGDFQNASATGNFMALNTTTGNKFAVDYNGNIINYSSFISPRGTFGKIENFIKHPQALDNAVWVKTGFTVTKDSDIAIDGKTTVDKLTTSGGGSDSIIQDFGFDPVSTTQTVGFWLKADNNNFRVYLESVNESTYIIIPSTDSLNWKFYPVTTTFSASSIGNLQLRIFSDSSSIFDIFFDRPCGVTGSIPGGYIATSDATVSTTYGGHVGGTFLLSANDEDSLFEQRAGDGQSGNLQELKNSSGVIQTKVTSSYHTIKNDNIKDIYGTGSDLEIFHDGTDNRYTSNNGRHLFTGNVEVANPVSGVGLTVGRASGSANIKSSSGFFAIDSAGTSLSLNRYVTDPIVLAQGGGNCGFFGSDFGGGLGIVFVKDAGTAPTTNPAGGGILYSVAGALTWRGSSGTITTIATA